MPDRDNGESEARHPKVDFIYFDAGGGHRSAALALQTVIGESDYGWDVRLVNLQEILDSLDIFRKVTGIRLEDIYNLILAKGWTLGSPYLLPMMHGIIRLYHPAQVKLLAEYWTQERPDMVVSLVPNFNRALFQSLTKRLPGVPFVTILTDLADYPPHFWMEKQSQYFICGSEKAEQQALDIGHPRSKVMRTSGMILRPEFYRVQQPDDRASERRRLGLDENLPTGLVLFGGEGSNVMYSIAEDLGNAATDLQLILICGRNGKLKQRLNALKTRNRLFVEGFTKEVRFYMSMADFFIGKPGPGSISEALKMKLPVIVESNAWTLPQERYNAEWLQEEGVGVVLKNFRDVEKAVRELLDPGRLQGTRERIEQLDNHSVFEIPPMLKKIMTEHARV